MTVPLADENATIDFRALLVRARDGADLVTTNQSYTMVEGVLRTFRRRLSVADALRFADVLPAVARAVFVSHWDPDEPRRPFDSRSAMTAEVQALRPSHDDAPDSCIAVVARALRSTVDAARSTRSPSTGCWPRCRPARRNSGRRAATTARPRLPRTTRTDDPERPVAATLVPGGARIVGGGSASATPSAVRIGGSTSPRRSPDAPTGDAESVTWRPCQRVHRVCVLRRCPSGVLPPVRTKEASRFAVIHDL